MNQNFSQQQMEQMRRQQEEQRRRMMMGAAWLDEQKKKAVKNAPPGWLQRQGHEVLQEWDHVRSAYQNGQLSHDQAEARLKSNLIEDRQGQLWAVGAQSGSWYRWQTGMWVKDARGPGSAPASAATSAQAWPSEQPVQSARAGRSGFSRLWSFLWRAVLFAALGFAAGSLVSAILSSLGLWEYNDFGPFLAAIAVWLFGLIKSLQAAGKN